MSKITLHLSTLALFTSLASNASANAPWADESQSDIPPPQAVEESMEENVEEVTQEESIGHPAAMEQAVEATPPAEETTEAPATVTETQTTGDVLQAPQAIGVRILDFPRRGMTTDKVENELGRPSEIIPAVGQPPISRWVYDDRIVYFERSTVIHVVAK